MAAAPLDKKSLSEIRFIYLRNHSENVERMLECQYGLLETLVERQVLYQNEIDNIRELQSTTEQNKKLLEIIDGLDTASNVTRSSLVMSEFLSCLSLTCQDHVSKYIQHNGDVSSLGEDTPLSDALYDSLTTNIESLKNIISLPLILLDYLKKYCIIGKEHWKAVTDRVEQSERVEVLINIMKRRTVKKYRLFKSCLRTAGQSDAVQLLQDLCECSDGQERSTSLEGLPQNETAGGHSTIDIANSDLERKLEPKFTRDDKKFQFMARSGWLAKTNKLPLDPHNTPVRFAVISVWSMAVDKSSIDDCCFHMRCMQEMHFSDMGFYDIAFNFIVAQNGIVFEGRGSKWAPSTVRGWNSQIIGLCFLGVPRHEPATKEAIEGMELLLQYLVENNILTADYTVYAIRQIAERFKGYPGDPLYNQIQQLSHWKEYIAENET